jgi:hypothetical protein
VAINGRTRLRDLDLWNEAGRARVVKKVLPVQVSDGRIEISFPRVTAGQAVISAIAISSADASVRPPPMPAPLISNLQVAGAAPAAAYAVRSHLDNGDTQFADAAGDFASLPWALVDADWIQTADASRSFSDPELLRFVLTADADVYVAVDRHRNSCPSWLGGWADTGESFASTFDGKSTFALYRRSFAAGATVVLGPAADPAGDHAMYTVIVTRRRPPPPAQTVVHLVARDNNWRAIGSLRSGNQQYGDDVATFSRLPAALAGCDWIQTERRFDAAVRASFTVNDYVEVYVALDAGLAAPPAWLADWIDTGLTLSTTNHDAGQFRLVKKRFVPGETVTLGANGLLPEGRPAATYTVAIRPVRPAVKYGLSAATFSGGAIVPNVAGVAGRAWQSGPAGSYLEWTVSIDVGDRYDLNFRYATAATAATPVEVSIIDSDGRVFRTDRLEFPSTRRPLEWSILRTRTGSSLNAGTYHIRLTTTDPTTVYLGSLEME